MLPGRADPVDPKVAAMGDFVTGEVALNDGNYDVGLKAFRAAVAHDPESPLLRQRLAMLLVRKGMLAEALEHCQKVVEIEPEQHRGAASPRRHPLGAESPGRGGRAVRQVIELEPRNQEAYLYLGALYGKQGKYDQAVATLTKLIELNPRSVLGYYYLGRVHTSAGQLDRAEHYFREALARNPQSELILMDLATLYELRKDYPKRDRALSADPRAEPGQRARAQATRRALHRPEEARRGAAPVPRAREDRERPGRDADQDRAHLLREGRVRSRRDRAEPRARGRARQPARPLLPRLGLRADAGVPRRRSSSCSASSPAPSTTSTRAFSSPRSTSGRTRRPRRSARSSRRSTVKGKNAELLALPRGVAPRGRSSIRRRSPCSSRRSASSPTTISTSSRSARRTTRPRTSRRRSR